ncbi:MAG: hypothetical protein M5U14_20895 [Acidimicrobiia bacterium]|nr:hypothetical protein [Acidimicrobiia bacterium]
MLAIVATMVDLVRRIAAPNLEPREGDWEMERFAAVADPDAVPSDLDGVRFVSTHRASVLRERGHAPGTGRDRGRR